MASSNSDWAAVPLVIEIRQPLDALYALRYRSDAAVVYNYLEATYKMSIRRYVGYEVEQASFRL